MSQLQLQQQIEAMHALEVANLRAKGPPRREQQQRAAAPPVNHVLVEARALPQQAMADTFTAGRAYRLNENGEPVLSTTPDTLTHLQHTHLAEVRREFSNSGYKERAQPSQQQVPPPVADPRMPQAHRSRMSWGVQHVPPEEPATPNQPHFRDAPMLPPDARSGRVTQEMLAATQQQQQQEQELRHWAAVKAAQQRRW
jgi:hypothetical protein